MSVAIAVGSAVSFPDFSFPPVPGDRFGLPTSRRLGPFRAPHQCLMPESVVVSVRVAKRVSICIIWPVFLSVFAILVLVHYNLIVDCGLT